MYTVPPGELTVTDEPTCKSKQEGEPGAGLKPRGQTKRKPLFIGRSSKHSTDAFT